MRLEGYRAVGPDDIHIAQLVDGLEVLAPFLADLFNSIISTGEYPRCWKQTTVKPIPKRLNLTQPKDCRPTSLQCTPAKVFDGILLY